MLVGITYLIALLWMVLFKTSVDIPGVFAVHIRALVLVPFVHSHLSEVIENVLLFIPLGFLVAMNFAAVRFLHKLGAIFVLSFLVETIQYIFSIGVSDITDVMTNTLGGFLGLALYRLGYKYIPKKLLDQFIITIILFLLGVMLFLRFFVFRVKY